MLHLKLGDNVPFYHVKCNILPYIMVIKYFYGVLPGLEGLAIIGGSG